MKVKADITAHLVLASDGEDFRVGRSFPVFHGSGARTIFCFPGLWGPALMLKEVLDARYERDTKISIFNSPEEFETPTDGNYVVMTGSLDSLRKIGAKILKKSKPCKELEEALMTSGTNVVTILLLASDRQRDPIFLTGKMDSYVPGGIDV